MNRFIYLFFMLLIISCAKKEERSFTIQGSIRPVKENFILLKKESDIERKISKVIDIIYLDKKGSFKAGYDLEPYLYTLQIDADNRFPLAIDKGQHINIKIAGAKTKITGSKDTEALLAYENYRKKSLDTLVQSVRRKVKALKKSDHPDENKIAALELVEVKNYEKHLIDLNRYLKNNMGTTIGLYATSIRWAGAENLAFYDSITNVFEAAHPHLEIAKKLREKVTRLQQTSVGGKAADIEMKNAEGTSISLATVNKKFTLIDFWASWCGPCRSESKILNELYKEYHDKGFEIYGVSLDDKRDKWVKALEKDQRNWPNVSSLEAFKTKAAYDYAVTALPMNYLIDSDFKIIGKNLHKDELTAILKPLFDE